MILENKVVQKLKLSKNYFYKKCAPKWVFFNDLKRFRKIRMIFDIENSLWKSDFDNFDDQMDSQNTVVSFDYSLFLAKNLAF